MSLFHPIVEGWFRERLGEPTEPQRLGWPEIAAGRNVLIAAPTGSGKTLAAFLVCIDRLLRRAIEGALEDRIQVVYVSPLKALSNDIRRNLEQPLEEIWKRATAENALVPPLRVAVRTGDTPAHERAAMLKKPPHLLVTTPESLYLLLTSPRGRETLAGVETVIVDEIHALARDKRGSHLALSLERLEALCPRPPARVGLSATQRPVEEIARFLVGARRVDAEGRPDCRIVDTGHARALDLDVELPSTPLSAVCSGEQWAEIDQRLVELIESHRSTLIFVNTRRLAERLSHRLTEKLGEGAVASHHGSLSKDIRLSAEERLKTGQLKAIVATASLELGIDIGFVDLVCQIGSPRSIAVFLQRVGRSGHRLGVVPKGRLFTLTRDELLEGLALLRAVRAGRLDAVEPPESPLDILAQQIVAEVSARDWTEDELYERFRAAWPYRRLERPAFDRIVRLLGEGLAPGRKDGAFLHRDGLNGVLRARRSARLASVTSGGAIPETADYRVVTEEEGTFVGTVNEDFAIESLAGDVFLLGNTSWRVRYVRAGQVVVTDAHGAPASVPFWLGEAPGRTIELSEELSRLREELGDRTGEGVEPAAAWLRAECGVGEAAARQAAEYVAAQRAAVGFVPSQRRILFERFFDDSGGMQLVIHSPYGARINRAWGLALRKRFCRSFDFELQASADDDGIVLSLGPQHSFPIEQMFSMLRPAQAQAILVQALLAAPMFQVRWRWNATRALAVLRMRGGKKVPPPLQRFRADDLLTAVFPAQTACLENRPGDIPVPDHPLVEQTVRDCLREAMDVDRWLELLGAVESGRVELVARDTREPSPFSHAILNANPYAFLDDAPLEERRARAIATRRTLSPEDVRDLAVLDPAAITRVREEAWPLVRDEEELHDALLSLVVLPSEEGRPWSPWFERLAASGRATALRAPGAPALWVAVERLSLVRCAFPGAALSPELAVPEALRTEVEPLAAAVEIVRGRLAVAGPTTAEAIARATALEADRVRGALGILEAEGFAVQGRFSGDASGGIEWCERRLLARTHRLSLADARRRVQAVTPEVYWRFLAEHQRLLPKGRREGRQGLYEAIAQLQGFEAQAAAWETDVLPARVEAYKGEWLDTLSFSGEMVWARLRERPAREDGGGAALHRAAPIALALRSDLGWMLPAERAQPPAGPPANATPAAAAVFAALQKDGALFFDDLAAATELLPSQVRDALGELAALGAVTSDGFAPLRGLVLARPDPSRRRYAAGFRRPLPPARAGRWTLFPGRVRAEPPEERAQRWAWQLLRRYGVLFRDLLARESVAPSWWELVPTLRRLEARGEVRGGRFVAGVGGEQFALPDAVEALRRPRESGEWVVVSASDPLNLAGILGPGPRVPAVRGNRLLYHDGRVAASMQGGELECLEPVPESSRERLSRLLRLQIPPLRDSLLEELRPELVSRAER